MRLLFPLDFAHLPPWENCGTFCKNLLPGLAHPSPSAGHRRHDTAHEIGYEASEGPSIAPSHLILDYVIVRPPVLLFELYESPPGLPLVEPGQYCRPLPTLCLCIPGTDYFL